MTVEEYPKGMGSETTTVCLSSIKKKPVSPSPTQSQGQSSCLLLSEPPDNIKAFWEISRSGPKAPFTDRHTHVSVRVFLCVNACLQLRKGM